MANKKLKQYLPLMEWLIDVAEEKIVEHRFLIN